MACTLTDVIACVPLEGNELDTVPSDYLNQLLTLISQLRGGGSRFLPLLLSKVSENLPLMTAPTPLPLPPAQMSAINQESANSSPTESSRSAPPMRPSPAFPMGPLTPSLSDSMPGGPSPPESHGLTMSSWTTPRVAMMAPVPRSVPRVPFDGQFG